MKNKPITTAAILIIVVAYCYVSNDDFNHEQQADQAIAQHLAEQRQCRASTAYAAQYAFQQGYLTREAEDMTNIKLGMK